MSRDAWRLPLRHEPTCWIQQIAAHSFRIDVQRIAHVVERERPAGVPPPDPDFSAAGQNETVAGASAGRPCEAANRVHEDSEAEGALA